MYIMHDPVKIRNASGVNMSLTQISPESVHKDKMRASNNRE